jgi:hypothetical protein
VSAPHELPRDHFFASRVVSFHVLVQNLDEFGYDAIALERGEQAVVDVGRGFGFFECAGQGNAQAGVISLKKVQPSSE